jgi:hypothetical protein
VRHRLRIVECGATYAHGTRALTLVRSIHHSLHALSLLCTDQYARLHSAESIASSLFLSSHRATRLSTAAAPLRESRHHRIVMSHRSKSKSSSTASSGSSVGEFQEQRMTFPIHLHPSRLGNVREGVEEQINTMLMTYARDTPTQGASDTHM